jgi:hypothetical protein
MVEQVVECRTWHDDAEFGHVGECDVHVAWFTEWRRSSPVQVRAGRAGCHGAFHGAADSGIELGVLPGHCLDDGEGAQAGRRASIGTTSVQSYQRAD